jgi:6,7-dimethyl-8-ribityllumazine synthase
VRGGGFWPGDSRSTEARPGEARAADEPRAGEPAAANGEVPEEASESVLPAPAARPADEPMPEAAIEAPPAEPAGEPAEEPAADDEAAPEPGAHAPGELAIPDDVELIEGFPGGVDRSVGIVVSRFNGEVTNLLLESALAELDRAGVARDRITVVPVPGAFELPFGAMALAKTRRFSCVVALGCVIRGETAHFDYVAGESASGLQLAGLETGVPVAFGVLTVDTLDQALARAGRGADAARSALEMADVYAQVRRSRS